MPCTVRFTTHGAAPLEVPRGTEVDLVDGLGTEFDAAGAASLGAGPVKDNQLCIKNMIKIPSYYYPK